MILGGCGVGDYTTDLDIDTEPTPKESWDKGVYAVDIFACEGMCGAPYPHTRFLVTAHTNFTINAGN